MGGCEVWVVVKLVQIHQISVCNISLCVAKSVSTGQRLYWNV